MLTVTSSVTVFVAARCRIAQNGTENKNSGRRIKSAKRKKVAASDFTAKQYNFMKVSIHH